VLVEFSAYFGNLFFYVLEIFFFEAIILVLGSVFFLVFLLRGSPGDTSFISTDFLATLNFSKTNFFKIQFAKNNWFDVNTHEKLYCAGGR
jgi:hypothetical protein